MPRRQRCDLTLLVAGDPDQLTGGYVYDARIVAALRNRGWQVAVQGLEGRFPEPDSVSRNAMSRVLAALPDGARVVIDGLAMGGMPDVIAPHADRLVIVALVHHPLADETGLAPSAKAQLFESESHALALARRVIVTSPYTARGLARYRVPSERIRVVEPGVDPAPLAASAMDLEVPGPRRLLCVATLTPRKGLDLLVEALAGLVDRDWTGAMVGSLDRDPAHAAKLLAQTQRLGLDERLAWLGECDAKGLAQAYHRAELFVLPSHYEGYGMVVTEALARGLPVLTTTGGALGDTLPPHAGIAVPPGDTQALREALAAWLDDAALRRRLRRGARQAREALADWRQAGERFIAALDDIDASRAKAARDVEYKEAHR
ncbi:glycosyltransferase family 4 protein [Halomonas korlensis]|uniref:Glycosyltransferase involved in cell wall bisynthesis n=1 Tax=Halomonas korlensis TaxID=463301 RepID=A0A1I7G073_9GAMM|nr:glycosyltransferase family 4 protein [Halomonas korlensis]SFU41706.1 Glycosyltransferase involved in cell wall bisynthesis [Halomonas korlensis]